MKTGAHPARRLFSTSTGAVPVIARRKRNA
jgi:hypothetical protein